MNIIYVHSYIVYVRTYIFGYVPIVGGLGGPLRDKVWADFGAKNWGKKIAIRDIYGVISFCIPNRLICP